MRLKLFNIASLRTRTKFLLLTALISFLAAVAAHIDWTTELVVRQESAGRVEALAPIMAQAPVSFVFTAPERFLAGLEIRLATYARTNHSRLTLSLHELEKPSSWPVNRSQARVIARQNLDAAKLKDWAWVAVRFPRQWLSQGRTYALELASPDADDRNCAALVGARGGKVFRAGAIVDGQPALGFIYRPLIGWKSQPAPWIWAAYLSLALVAVVLVWGAFKPVGQPKEPAKPDSPPDRKVNWFSRLGEITLIGLLSAVLGLGLLELGFRFFLYPAPEEVEADFPFWVLSTRTGGYQQSLANRYFDHRPYPNTEAARESLSVKPLPEEFAARYTVDDLVLPVNEWGFHKVYKNSPNPFPNRPGRLKILCLGGSTMVGVGSRYDESIPAQLSRWLSGKGVAATVINGGVLGFNIRREFMYFSLEGIKLKPDVVVMLDGWNDHYDNWADEMPSLKVYDAVDLSNRNDRVPLLRGLTAAARAVIPNIVRFIDERTANLNKERQAMGQWLGRMRRLVNLSKEDLLRNCIGVARSNGAAIVIALQPEIFSKDANDLSAHERLIVASLPPDLASLGRRNQKADWSPARGWYQRLGQEFKSDNRVQVLDLLGAFNGRRETTYWDFIHYTARGNRLLAEKLGRAILKTRP